MTQYQEMKNDMNSSLYPSTDDVEIPLVSDWDHTPVLDDESEDDESVDENSYEYNHYGIDKETQEIIVAGGGLMNGNAYATIKVIDESTVLYREYGPKAWSELYTDSMLKYSDEGFSFDVVSNT